MNHQMNMSKLPMHRDLAGFDFSASSADARLVKELSSLEFTETAQNVVFIGGPGTGKTHLASALAVSGITTHNKRVRFFSTVDLVKNHRQPRRIARQAHLQRQEKPAEFATRGDPVQRPGRCARIGGDGEGHRVHVVVRSPGEAVVLSVLIVVG